MGLERRSRAGQGQPAASPPGEEPRARPGPKVKSSVIGKRLIVQAWEKVRASNGAPGVDAIGVGLYDSKRGCTGVRAELDDPYRGHQAG